MNITVTFDPVVKGRAKFSPVAAWSIPAGGPRLLVSEIQERVASFYDLQASDMKSARRARAISRPRQVAMYLARRLTPRSLPDIGRRFGDRDHTTVMHAIRTVERLRLTDPEIDAEIRRLERILQP